MRSTLTKKGAKERITLALRVVCLGDDITARVWYNRLMEKGHIPRDKRGFNSVGQLVSFLNKVMRKEGYVEVTKKYLKSGWINYYKVVKK